MFASALKTSRRNLKTLIKKLKKLLELEIKIIEDLKKNLVDKIQFPMPKKGANYIYDIINVANYINRVDILRELAEILSDYDRTWYIRHGFYELPSKMRDLDLEITSEEVELIFTYIGSILKEFMIDFSLDDEYITGLHFLTKLFYENMPANEFVLPLSNHLVYHQGARLFLTSRTHGIKTRLVNSFNFLLVPSATESLSMKIGDLELQDLGMTKEQYKVVVKLFARFEQASKKEKELKKRKKEMVEKLQNLLEKLKKERLELEE